MKATLTKTLALTALLALLALGGQAFAAQDAHEGYQRGFYGKHAQDEATAGKAAFGTTTKVAFATPQGGTRVLTTNGVQAWDQGEVAANTVTSGGASSSDGHEGYRKGIAGRF